MFRHAFTLLSLSFLVVYGCRDITKNSPETQNLQVGALTPQYEPFNSEESRSPTVTEENKNNSPNGTPELEAHINSKSLIPELSGSISEPGKLAKYISLCEPETRVFLDQCPALKTLKFQNYTAAENFDASKTLETKKFYDKTNGLIMIILSGISYFNRSSQETETELRNLIAGFGFNRIDFLDNSKNGFEAIVASNHDNILIGFRGTDDFTDIFTDSKLEKKDFAWGKIHDGFAKLMDENWEVFAKVVAAHGYDFSKPYAVQHIKKRIWMTGHSLGAALATSFASKFYVQDAALNGIDLQSKPSADCTKANSQDCELTCEKNAGKFESGLAKIYAFALPPLGDREFSRCFTANLRAKHFRFTYNSDPVVSLVLNLPNDLGYSHPQTLIYFDDNGAVKAGEEAAKHEQSLGYKLKIKNINDHRIKNYLGNMITLSNFQCPEIKNIPTLLNPHRAP